MTIYQAFRRQGASLVGDAQWLFAADDGEALEIAAFLLDESCDQVEVWRWLRYVGTAPGVERGPSHREPQPLRAAEAVPAGRCALRTGSAGGRGRSVGPRSRGRRRVHLRRAGFGAVVPIHDGAQDHREQQDDE